MAGKGRLHPAMPAPVVRAEGADTKDELLGHRKVSDDEDEVLRGQRAAAVSRWCGRNRQVCSITSCTALCPGPYQLGRIGPAQERRARAAY